MLKQPFYLLKKINEYFDYKLSIDSKNLEQSSNKDMIFEILMMRFDILQKYRKAVISIFNSFKKRPHDLLFLLPNIIDSIVMMIGYTNISSKGVVGQLRIKGILIIYTSCFFSWINDNSSSLEKTMMTLDKSLDQAGKIIKFIK